MYYPDFSEYGLLTNQGHNPFTLKEVHNIGWLENGYDYPKGKVDERTLSKIKALLASPKNNINQTRGIHQCDICDASSDPFVTHRIVVNTREIPLGSSELCVPDAQGRIYAAPTLIYHYIVKHSYLPPNDFIEAINQFDVASDWNGKEIFRALVQKYRS
jgi:hypothetical protein